MTTYMTTSPVGSLPQIANIKEKKKEQQSVGVTGEQSLAVPKDE